MRLAITAREACPYRQPDVRASGLPFPLASGAMTKLNSVGNLHRSAVTTVTLSRCRVAQAAGRTTSSRVPREARSGRPSAGARHVDPAGAADRSADGPPRPNPGPDGPRSLTARRIARASGLGARCRHRLLPRILGIGFERLRAGFRGAEILLGQLRLSLVDGIQQHVEHLFRP